MTELIEFMWAEAWPDRFKCVESMERSTGKKAFFVTDFGHFDAVDDTYISRYRPLADSGLFRTFAETAPTTEGILEFANSHGWLGLKRHPISARDEHGREYEAGGESIKGWAEEIRCLRSAVNLWHSLTLTTPDAKGIQTGIQELWAVKPQTLPTTVGDILSRGLRARCRTTPIERPSRELPTRAADIESHAEVFGPPDDFDDPLPATVYAELEDVGEFVFTGASEVIEVTERNAIVQLRPIALNLLQRIANDQLAGSVSARLRKNRAGTELRLRFMPQTLLAAIWLQFATAMAGNKSYRQCSACGKWFEVSPDIARTNRRYCSGPCRSHQYRARQTAARKMRADGVAIEDIADNLGTTVEKVNGWLERRDVDEEMR